MPGSIPPLLLSSGRIRLWLSLLLVLLGPQASAETDPAAYRRIFPAITGIQPVMAALAPERMTSLSFPLREEAFDLLPPVMRSLPLINTLNGLNGEQVLVTRPDLAVAWSVPHSARIRIEALMEQLHVPSYFIAGQELRDYPQSFRRFGRLLGLAERGETLAADLEDREMRLDARLEQLGDRPRPRIYYAESPDGLDSQCADSTRVEVIRRARAIAVPACHSQGFSTRLTVSLETLLQLDPDVILARDARTADTLRRDPLWQGLRAIREGRLYAIPHLPFNWFDRPPSFMRSLGSWWLADTLYPELHLDTCREFLDFNALFFGIRPGPGACPHILNRTAS